MSVSALLTQLELAYGKAKLARLTVVPKSTVDYELYHISTDDKIKEFIPRFSTKTIDGEDQSIVRTSTASTLLGCMKGYGNVLYAKNQIFHVYEMDWKYAVRPDKKLMPDVQYTDEHWLVPYLPNYRSYKGNIVASFQLYRSELYYVDDKVITNSWILVHNTKAIKVTPNIVLESGYWEMECCGWNGYLQWNPILDQTIRFHKLSEAEYNKKRQLTTGKKVLDW